MDNKKIAHHALSFIGGTPEVFEYHNDDKTKSIDIMTCKDENMSDMATVSTIGLAATDIGMLTEDDKPLRTELIMLAAPDEEVFANIISSTAFDIQDAAECEFGLIIPNAVSNYISDSDVQHLVLLSPVFWDKYEPLEVDDAIVTWLLAVPITEAERQFIDKNDLDEFTDLLDQCNVDLADLWRESCV